MKKPSDISVKEDLCLAVMNLISLEEHLYFTGMKTKKDEYFAILDSIRGLRKSLMKELVTNTEGELWCISKHLLAATMRLIETGNKYTATDQKKAKSYFDSAFDTFSLFWFLQRIGVNNASKTGKKGK